MFTRTLSRLASAVPSDAKLALSRCKPFYNLVMRTGQPCVVVTTAAGTFQLRVDALTSQEFVLGTYEKYMQEAFARVLHAGSVVYDVGAHVGFHSLFCGLLVGKTGMVVAFEPNPETYESLTTQVIANSTLAITTSPFAISDRSGRSKLNTVRGGPESQVSDLDGVLIETRTIDQLVQERCFPPPNVIKIDVEGHEGRVIAGAIKSITHWRPVILCDYDDDTTLSTVAALLDPLGYETVPGPPITSTCRGHSKFSETAVS